MATIGPILALLSQLDFSSSPQPPTVDVGMEQDLLHGRIFCHPPPQAQQAVTGTTIQQSILHDPPFFLQPPSQPQKFGLGVQHGSQEQQRVDQPWVQRASRPSGRGVASDYEPARATAAKTAWGVSRLLSDALSSREVFQESPSDDDTSESAPAPKQPAYAAARSMAGADSIPNFSLGTSSDDDDDGSDYAPTPAAKKCAPASASSTARGRPSGVYRAAAKRARETGSDDSTSDGVPLSARKHAPPSTPSLSKSKSAPPPQWKSPAPPPPDSPANPTPSHRPKLTLNLKLAAKRARLEPPRAADASESELDIIITHPEPARAPKPTHTSAPRRNIPSGSSDEIAKAVAEIIDSPVWARAAQISAARVAARKEKERERQGARGEDGDDWEYSHLPRWYKPFECTDCGQSFYKQGSLTRHLKVSLPRYLCPKRRAGLDVDSRKTRKLAPMDSSEDESPADDMIVETECMMPSSSSLPPISSAQPTSSSPRLPSPLAQCSSPSPLPIPRSSPPTSDYDDQNLAAGDAQADITNSALHERLLSAEKLIRAMQAEIGALRDVVQENHPAASPVLGDGGGSDWEGGEDGDWSLDG
ncbi:hypothetical protein AURDEDRAFT_163529 [Auricularia subglabra TFB-10046 SS5]|nr:hypothetical protein AURDEDRAFT_163529 [Auricularia subglabra TFB-10046 SS5]